MYNAEYHEISAENLNWMLAGESKEHADIINKQVAAAKAAKTRNYIVELPDGTNYVVTNGLIQGSRGYRG